MRKLSKGTIIGSVIGIIVFGILCCGVTYLVKRINGTTDAQIEARKRANDAADESLKAMEENAQWHNDLMSQPITVTNSEGEEVSYSPHSAKCINSSVE